MKERAKHGPARQVKGSQNFLEWKPSARNEFTPVALEAVKSMRILSDVKHVVNRHLAIRGNRDHRH